MVQLNINMIIRIVKNSIKRSELEEIAREGFGDLIKAVVDTEQEIMAVGGELHADEEVELTNKEDSKRGDTWGINLYLKRTGGDWIEFDSMINLKPHYGNRSRNVENPEIREKIRKIVNKLIAN